MRKSLWIKVSDRLPPILKKTNRARYPCMFVVEKTNRVHAGAFMRRIPLWPWSSHRVEAFESQDGSCFDIEEVSHWRRLPEAPRRRSPESKNVYTGSCTHATLFLRDDVIDSNGILDFHVQTCSGCGKVLKRWNTPTQKGN